MRAVYTETESIYVYTETKNQGYYNIYIVTLENLCMSIPIQNMYVFIRNKKPGLLYIYYSTPGKTKAHLEGRG